MKLKVAIIKVAVDAGFISEEEAADIYGDIQSLSYGEICGLANMSPVPLDDPGLISTLEQAIADNPKAVSDYLAGKEKAINKIMGQLMRMTRGRNDAGPLLEMVKEKIAEKPHQ